MPAAVAIPALVQAGGSILSGVLGSSASKKAAQQQANAQQAVIDNTKGTVAAGQDAVATGTTNANDILSRSAQTQLGMYSPYVNAGQDALTGIQQLAGANGPLADQFSFNPTDLQNDPGYAFALKQGQDAINRSAAAKGGLFSSSTIKSLSGYNTGMASTHFNEAYQRAANTFNINRQGALARVGTLQGLAGMGLQGTSAGAGAVGTTSSQQAQNAFGQGVTNAGIGLQGNQTIATALTGKGNSEAAGTIGSTNSILSGIGGVGNSLSGAAINQFLLSRGVFGKPSGGGSQLPGGQTYNFPQPPQTYTGDDAGPV